MKITYTGTGTRIIEKADFPDRADEDDFRYEWTPGSWVDVDEETGKYLVEFSRHEFVEYDDPKGRDHRTRDELMEEAKELDIKGRSSMDKEELRDAIYSRRAELEGEPEGESTSKSEAETLEEIDREVEEALGRSTPVITQDDNP
jgi:hypothetical protein